MSEGAETPVTADVVVSEETAEEAPTSAEPTAAVEEETVLESGGDEEVAASEEVGDGAAAETGDVASTEPAAGDVTAVDAGEEAAAVDEPAESDATPADGAGTTLPDEGEDAEVAAVTEGEAGVTTATPGPDGGEGATPAPAVEGEEGAAPITGEETEATVTGEEMEATVTGEDGAVSVPEEEGADTVPGEEAATTEDVPAVEGESAEPSAEEDTATGEEGEDSATASSAKRKPSKSGFMAGVIEEEGKYDDEEAALDRARSVTVQTPYSEAELPLEEEEDQVFADASDDEEEFATPKMTREQVVDQIQQLMAERSQLRQKNQQYQHKLAIFFQKKRTEGEDKPSPESDQRYGKLLTQFIELRNNLTLSREVFNEEADKLRDSTEASKSILRQQLQQFAEKKKDMLLNQSISAKTGRPIKPSDIEPVFALEDKKDEELSKVQLEHIQLRNSIQKIDSQLKAKEQLGEGLHMIDFEQLKIENQSYNEKIEERNEEVAKLKRKIKATVEVLSHLKEKIEFVASENSVNAETLADLDQTVSTTRDHLTGLKRGRDSLRADNDRLKQSSGLLGKNDLLRDYEDKVDLAESLKRRLDEMKYYHSESTLRNGAMKKKIAALQPNLQALRK